MPLLGDEIFVKRSHPDLISTNPDSRFIYFPLTDELFEKHEDYFERYIQCFSDVWTCQYTKSSNLTFEGAMRSEENFLKNQSKIPRCFHLPILLLVHHMKPENSLRKLASKINFVLSLFYFKGETVGFRKFAQNERNAGIRFNIEALSFDRDFLNKSRTQSSDNNNCEGQSDQISSDDCAIDNQLMNDFRYSIEYKLLSSNNVSETASMKMIKTKDRHANYYNVDSIMIFLKDYIQFHNQEYNKSIACVKPHVIQEYRLDDPEVFVTNFPFRSPSILNKIVELCPENLELTRPFDLPVNPSPKKTNRHAETAQNSESSKSIIQKSIAVLAEEEKLRKQKEAEEKKQALQAAKILEARRREELIIKEKRLKEDYVRHLNIPREDFLSEDLRPFEKSVTIETEEGSKVDEHVPIISDMNHWKSSRLSEDQFLSVLEISEFINLFSPVLNDMFFQNFPSGIDLSLIESCILSKSPDSSYGEILQMLLSTVSNLQKLDSSNIQIECNYFLSV
ncbi:MAG: Bromodomain adjacent to zinc finger domain protein 1A, partial [Marteilia pararefringens]